MEVEVDEAYLRAVAAEDDVIHPRDAELYAILHEELRLEEGEIPSPEKVAKAAMAEITLQMAVGTMDGLLEDLRRGAASFAARPGEEELVAALLSKAEEAEAWRAWVMATADAGRLIQEHDLRRMAATEKDAFYPEKARAVEQAHREMVQAVCSGAALRVERVLAAEYAAQALAAELTALAGRLRKGAAAFASRPGEEAVTTALQSKAESVEWRAAEAQNNAEGYRTFRLSLPFRYSYECMDKHFQKALTM